MSEHKCKMCGGEIGQCEEEYCDICVSCWNEKIFPNTNKEIVMLTKMLDSSRKDEDKTLKSIITYKKVYRWGLALAPVGLFIMLLGGFGFDNAVTIFGFFIAGVGGFSLALVFGIYYLWQSKVYIKQKENNDRLEKRIQELKERIKKEYQQGFCY